MKSSQCGSGMSFSRFLMECGSLSKYKADVKKCLSPIN